MFDSDSWQREHTAQKKILKCENNLYGQIKAVRVVAVWKKTKSVIQCVLFWL